MLARVTADELLAAAVPFRVPLVHRFRGVTSREGLLLRGPAGWGEFAPFAEYPPAVASRWLSAAVEAAYVGWPDPVRDEVPVNAIVPELAADEAAAYVRSCLEQDGTSTFKVKVSGDAAGVGADEDRVAAVRAALDHARVPGARIRVDVNGAWSVREAAVRLPVLDRAARGLEYVEQPCATLEEMVELRALVGVPLAADEVVRLAADPDHRRFRRTLREAADVVVVKPTPMGGVAQALRVAAALRLPAVVSGAMDTSVGLAAGIAAAAALPELPFACGLGTGALLADDVAAGTSRPEQGRLRPVRTEPDPEALARARARVDVATEQAWRRRLREAWDAGTAAGVGR